MYILRGKQPKIVFAIQFNIKIFKNCTIIVIEWKQVLKNNSEGSPKLKYYAKSENKNLSGKECGF